MRQLNKKLELAVKIIAATFGLLYFYMAGFGVFSSESNRGLYLLFTSVLCILLYPAYKKKANSKFLAAIDALLIILVTSSIIYWISQYSEYGAKRVGMPNQFDFWFGVMMIILTLEVTRRVMGNVLTILGALFVIQLYFGQHLPGILANKGFSIQRIVEFNYSTMEGIFGTVTSVFATYVMPFLIFGAFLQKSGGGDFFIDLASALAGHVSGGPALIAVGGSAVFGSISGSPVANVVATGAFTIPMMKKVGYTPEFAGAVEAAASTGGQFLPPVMGAGAFILATLTETPYSEIMIMAAVPALLYYFSLTTMVYFRAKKRKLRGLNKEELPKTSEVMRKGWYYLFVIILAIVLIVTGYSPPLVAFWSTVFVIGASMFRKETRFTVKKFIDTLETAARSSLMVGATAGTIGLVMGGITLSGLGVKFSAMILSLSHGSILLTIVLIGLVATIVGMGLPTTASYIVLAILAAPSLVQLGIPVVQAHLLCFWLSMTSNITPPVCVAAFAGASVSGGHPMKTGFHAFKLGIFLYLMPVAFVFAPQLLILGSNFIDVAEIITSYAFATIALSAVVQGWLIIDLKRWERAIYLISVGLMATPDIITDLVGLFIFGAFTGMSFLRYQRTKGGTQFAG